MGILKFLSRLAIWRSCRRAAATDAVRWDDLRQRLVYELRRELYHLNLPPHLQAFRDSGLLMHEDIYEREIVRWESDVKWCADELSIDRLEFIRECQNTHGLQGDDEKPMFGTFIAEIGPDYKGLKPLVEGLDGP